MGNPLSQFEGIRSMSKRLRIQGGDPQQNRMIHDKRWTLDHAVKYSYQAAKIKRVDVEQDTIPALINPNKLKQDYDDKVLSVGFEYKLQPGDVFEWCNTDTKWLIYLQDLTELAYFRGDIRKCSYEVQWLDENGNLQHTYLAVRGPVETKIDYIQKNGTSVDNPNYSINFLMPKTKETLSYFKRYARFYLQGLAEGTPYVCWRVEAVDSISMQGVMSINAVEYYANKTEDDIENGIANGLKNKENGEEEIEPKLMKGALLRSNAGPSGASSIVGEGRIRPNIVHTYTYIGADEAQWHIDAKAPVKYKINGKKIQIKWTKSFAGQINLSYGDNIRTIIVDSLF